MVKRFVCSWKIESGIRDFKTLSPTPMQCCCSFIPEKLSLPMTIAMADEVLSDLQSRTGTDSPKLAYGQGSEQKTELELPRFQAMSACTVAKCIDALENILMYQRTQWPIRLGIIIIRLGHSGGVTDSSELAERSCNPHLIVSPEPTPT